MAVFVSAHGAVPKYALRYRLGSFREQYDVHRPWEKIDIVRDLVRIIEKETNNFLENFLAVDEKYYRESSHRTRHYISRQLNALYPDKTSEFCEKYSFSYKGYWIGTNIGAKEIIQYVREMCEAGGITFGTWSDLKL